MKVLIDIGHPGHVHLFKNFAHIFIQKGHQVLFTVRQKEYEIELLSDEHLPYKVIGRHYKSAPGKIWGLFFFNIKILLICVRFRPDVYLSHGSVYTLLSALILRKPNIALEDTGNYEQVRLYLPFTSAVLTSRSLPYNYGKKQVFYEGYHELAYLHPDQFKPDHSVIGELGLTEGEKYFIVRFIAWNASHDWSNTGLTATQKREIISLLSGRGRVFISAEGDFPDEFERYRFPLKPDRMHHALAFATLYVGEGATMASECAVLGTPSIFTGTGRWGYLKEQEEVFGLVSGFSGYDGVIDKIEELLNCDDLKSETKKKSKRLIQSKCDVTAFLVKFIEEWPESYLREIVASEQTEKQNTDDNKS